LTPDAFPAAAEIEFSNEPMQNTNAYFFAQQQPQKQKSKVGSIGVNVAIVKG
jgi:hypothetical protein